MNEPLSTVAEFLLFAELSTAILDCCCLLFTYNVNKYSQHYVTSELAAKYFLKLLLNYKCLLFPKLKLTTSIENLNAEIFRYSQTKNYFSRRFLRPDRYAMNYIEHV